MPYSSTVTLSWLVLALIVVLALAGGASLLFLYNLLRRRKLQRQIEAARNRSIRNPDYGKWKTDIPSGTGTEQSNSRDDADRIILESVHIKNFKNVEEIKLNFTRESTLTGHWTCIAGINGAGKSTLLQALCLVLLGSDYVTELGRVRLGRMRRRSQSGTADAEIEAIVRQGGVRRRLYLPLSGKGVDEEMLRQQADFPQMQQTWNDLRKQILVCYGASRNVSDYKDPRYESISMAVQRQMTLFDPLTQIASVDVLLKGGREADPVLETLYRVLKVVLGSEGLTPERSEAGAKIQFSLRDATMDVIDLPDGFRTTVAWLADLCAAWHDRADGEKADTDPTSITGIVMLDELGLHLHPSFEKALVPQLRKALPRVQFIVSTHSPLVLSSFDRAELVMLDANSPTGTRELDRQVFGFTMDDIYAWLMDTTPGSPVMEEMLVESSDPELAVLLYQSKDVSEDGARVIIAEREKQIAKLQRKVDEL
jgi:ABC-type molybdenum transport system ATPase subunit/photorepair protein PhrA